MWRRASQGDLRDRRAPDLRQRTARELARDDGRRPLHQDLDRQGAARDFREQTGQMVGVKPAGGIRTAKDAIKYLVMVNEVAGADWLDPHWFRFGASTLLNELLMQRTKMKTGRYSGPDYFTLD